MNILEAKIIRCFVYVTYLFGHNVSKETAQKIIEFFEGVFNLKLNEKIKSILINEDLSMKNLNLFIRKYQYMKMINEDVTEEILRRDVYTLAKESIDTLSEAKIKIDDSSISVLKSKEVLRRALPENLVVLNFIYAIVNKIGLFTKEDDCISTEYLTRNSRWNDETSILCLAYNYYNCSQFDLAYYWYKIGFLVGEDFQDYDTMIKECLKKINQKEALVIDELVQKDIILHNLLKDERASAQYNPLVYNPNIASIIYEGSFSLAEKQRLLFSKQQIDFYDISQLVTKNEIEVIDKCVIKNSFRVKEQQKIIAILNDMIKNGNNGPLIITCKSKILLDVYCELIESYFSKYVVLNLDASRCDYRSLDRTYALNNYLYQNISEHQTSNIAIMYHNLQDVMEKDLNLFLGLLIKDIHYLIQDIEVSIDKSHLINIIFTFDINSLDKRIVQSSDVIVIDEALDNEKEEITRIQFTNELERKKILFNDEFEDIIKYISEKIPYTRLNEVITKVISRMSLNDYDDAKALVDELVSSRVIGF